MPALKEFTGTFPRGALTVVFGPSGSGKTTLLKAIGTLLPPTSGTVWYGNTNPYSLSKEDLRNLRKRIGISFQEPIFVPSLTLWENIELALNAAGKLNAEHKKLALNLADELGVRQLLNKKAHQVSGGEKRRIAIVMALSKNPEVLIMDEPTAYLDGESTERLLSLIQRLKEDRIIIAATHDPELVKVGNVTYRLRYGKKISER
ncbi:ABC transporter ATP-binding protein [Thermococcus profundus]|uniref:ABC transporter ATP-binding protein n=1 Tax=Thermococcus profundus TaxID=49899 RepID=UPI0012FD5704|nr:ABC transporter ATP-binding protein [Thermococcus profundus]